jgi:hypothetical protein
MVEIRGPQTEKFSSSGGKPPDPPVCLIYLVFWGGWGEGPGTGAARKGARTLKVNP